MNETDYSTPMYRGAAGNTADAAITQKRRVTEPVIQYAKTGDGVSIAYFSVGEGDPLLYIPAGGSVGQSWQMPELRSWLERLSAGRRVIRMDHRSLGLSDRGWKFSSDHTARDVEAVAKKEGLSRFAIFGQLHTAATAIVYAHRHPEKVSRLILWCPYANTRSYFESSPALQAALAAGEKDGPTLSELVGLHASGWDDLDQARRFAAYLRQGGCIESYMEIEEFDLREQLRELTMPVLVLHRRDLPFPNVELARQVAAACQMARLVVLDGNALMPFFGDAASVLTAIHEFLGEAQVAPPDHLTERELEILALLARGASSSGIANGLSISTRTVDRHIGNIYRKIGAHNRAEATAYAYERGIAAVL
jgi:pimeloyl-ACP methyl ester carboxylesterase/DNA-binding CsgD family transcriptional regulator